MKFDCTACKHHKPNHAFRAVARTYLRLGDDEMTAHAAELADRAYAKCQLTGEYCEAERRGGPLAAFFGRRCGPKGRFLEPK